MKLSQLITSLEIISGSNSRLFIADEISKIFQAASDQEAKPLTYFLCGKLGPDYESKVISIGAKQLLLILKDIYDDKLFQTILKLYSELGDLSQALYKALEQELSCKEFYCEFKDSDLLEFFEFISGLCDVKGRDSVQSKGLLIKDFLINQSPLSAKYVAKAILGQMRLGFLEMTVIDGLSKAFGKISDKKVIEDSYNRCTDLGLIAKVLKRYGICGLESLNISPGIPVRGAAAQAMEDPEDIVQKLGPVFVAQPKLDGLRLQVHFLRNYKYPSESSVYLFSRNLLNVSDMFPDLQKAFVEYFQENPGVQNFIVEGEVICFDRTTGHFLPFQETAKRKRKYAVDEFSQSHPIKFFVFDLLFYNNDSFIEKGHCQRRVELKNLLSKSSEQIISLISEVEFSGQSAGLELESYFNSLIDQGLEGLVAKKPEASYKAGKRDFSWIKLKRIDSGELYDSIDAVVLGYYEGLGRRAAFGIGGFLVGIYLPESGIYQSIAKVGSGLSDEQWVTLKKELDTLKLQSKPDFYDLARELEPSVWTSPRVVFSVRADQVTKSKVHLVGKKELGFGLALRFPRIVAIRKDKSEQQTTPAETLIEMFVKKSTKVLLKT